MLALKRCWAGPFVTCYEMKAKILSAGVVVVRFIQGAPHYLLLRLYNYWDFPKGMVEEGEVPLDAARREVEEETSLKGLNFLWGHAYKETPPYGKGKVARYYLALAEQGEVKLPVSPELGRPEHHEFRWLEYQAALDVLSTRLKPILDWAHEQVTAEQTPKGEVIEQR